MMVVTVLLLCDYDGADNGIERRFQWRDDGDGAHIGGNGGGGANATAGSDRGGLAEVVCVVVVVVPRQT